MNTEKRDELLAMVIEVVDECMDNLVRDMLVESIARGIYEPANASDDVEAGTEEEEDPRT